MRCNCCGPFWRVRKSDLLYHLCGSENKANILSSSLYDWVLTLATIQFYWSRIVTTATEVNKEIRFGAPQKWAFYILQSTEEFPTKNNRNSQIRLGISGDQFECQVFPYKQKSIGICGVLCWYTYGKCAMLYHGMQCTLFIHLPLCINKWVVWEGKVHTRFS